MENELPYAEETPAVKVPLNTMTANLNDSLIVGFGLNPNIEEKWTTTEQSLIEDITNTILGRETAVGLKTSGAEVINYLQQTQSQQHILVLAAAHLSHRALEKAIRIIEEERSAPKPFSDLNDLLGKLFGNGSGE